MIHIKLQDVLDALPANVIQELDDAAMHLASLADSDKHAYIKNGSDIWSQTKSTLEAFSSRKCWYTESTNPGMLHDVDHFRPKAEKAPKATGRVFWYWFLTFEPSNYRLSCHISNRRNRNPETDQVGGKGTHFPLRTGSTHATSEAELVNDVGQIIDPCDEDDVKLLAFQPDGRPVVHPAHRDSAEVRQRVEVSKLLLNLDFPTFNEGRESLYNDIKRLVEHGDGLEPNQRTYVEQELEQKMHRDSPYSKAADCYIRCFRDRSWIDQLFSQDG